ncbi:MAG TPA: biotin transporter BioY [Geminicoccaceae bacterium]|nr:biotin transporter BioY [Geminicoccaceae bacterium]
MAQQQDLTYPTLADALWSPAAGSNAVRAIALAVAGSILLTISAKIQVPFWPVPMTMQTFVVLVLGVAYGWRLAGATVLLYLGEGALGLPVFAGGGGLAYMAGPTGGYLIGFLLAAVAVGWLAERGWARSVPSTLAAMLVGTAIIFACGIAWLGALIGLPQAIGAGLVPFLLSEAVKVALATALVPFAWRLLQRG